MSITSITTQTQPRELNAEQITQVQEAVQKLINDPAALALARLQLIMNIAETDDKFRAQFHVRILELLDLARSTGHEVF